MKVSRETSCSDTKNTPERCGADPLLPHEVDQDAGSQEEHASRRVGKQAYRDIERGLQDTDRRGGDAYQRRTQCDANVNVNARKRR